ncbi:hypothetical protein LCGC14_1593460 [marine sediment metagenome]|uniref:Uncharacterized protein n=1 Tax=marine sediment metagenome TaxID=412755 RepID=A0A0F9LDR7_9ZZZZ
MERNLPEKFKQEYFNKIIDSPMSRIIRSTGKTKQGPNQPIFRFFRPRNHSKTNDLNEAFFKHYMSHGTGTLRPTLVILDDLEDDGPVIKDCLHDDTRVIEVNRHVKRMCIACYKHLPLMKVVK